MRNLLLVMGAPGSGKSTWIKDNNLEMYTLSADMIRLQHSSPVLIADGSRAISQKNDKAVWETLMLLLEFRMQRGMFTIIDATHSRSKLLRQYEKLCEKYRYRVYIKRFDVPVKTLIDRDNAREPYKRVPHDAIELMYTRLQSIEIPKKFTIIDDISEINEYVRYDLQNEDHRDVYFIGDIHGHADELEEFIRMHYNTNDLYVFLGDYIGRGYDDRRVIDVLSNLHDNGNVILLEGNHERHIRAFGFDDDYSHDELYPLILSEYTRKDARVFYRKLRPFFVFNKGGFNYLACHGGIPTPHFDFAPTEQLIKGVGKYEDVYENARTFSDIANGKYIQVHGHRSIDTRITLAPGVHDINGGLGNNGNLFALKVTNSGHSIFEITNTHIDLCNPREITQLPDSPNDAIASIMENKNINKNEFGDIVSLNFKRSVFYSRKWNELSIKARGLFVNKNSKNIVARSYDKFFNLNEFESHTMVNLIHTVKFPVKEFKKENGYLGIVGYDVEHSKVLYCSKSSLNSEHAKWLRKLLEPAEVFLNGFLAGGEYSLVFEVCLPEEDPHIIEYSEPRLYLLDIVENQIKFKSLPDIESFITKLRERGVNVYAKELISVAENAEDLIRNVHNTKSVQYEGGVYVDSNNFMFKVKSDYYTKWKQLRSYKDTKLYNSSIKVSALAFDTEAFEFLSWCKRTYTQEEAKHKSIIRLRKEFYGQSEK